MSSDVQSALALQRITDYGSLVIIVAVSYDYCVTFSNEVTYIWRRRWTWVSLLFLLIRYAGYLSVFWNYLHTIGKGKVVYLLGNWTYLLFWAGADMMMILRVYAMYNRSRLILSVLLVMYLTEVVFLFVSSSIYGDPTYVTISVIPLLDLTLCNVSFSSTQSWNNASAIIQFILGTVLCVLVVTPLVRELLQTRRATRKWQLNGYMRLLVREGVLYFIVTLFYSLVIMLGLLGVIPLGWVTLVFFVAINIPLYMLTPRFVMNVRELYALETEGRKDIDTGFGLSSGVARGIGESTTVGTMAFAQGPGGLEDGEEIAMVDRTEGSRKQACMV